MPMGLKYVILGNGAVGEERDADAEEGEYRPKNGIAVGRRRVSSNGTSAVSVRLVSAITRPDERRSRGPVLLSTTPLMSRVSRVTASPACTIAWPPVTSIFRTRPSGRP